VRPRVVERAGWASSGQNDHNTRFAAAEDTIDSANVGSLRPKWVFTTHGDVSATATVVSGVVYFPDWGGKLWAIDAQTGRARWSTSSIGEAAVRTFVAAGWRVVATGRRRDRLEALVASLGTEWVYLAAFDVRDEEARDAPLASMPAESRDVDLLINNAGLALGANPAQQADFARWRTMGRPGRQGTVPPFGPPPEKIEAPAPISEQTNTRQVPAHRPNIPRAGDAREIRRAG
jgi:hypothetical protein